MEFQTLSRMTFRIAAASLLAGVAALGSSPALAETDCVTTISSIFAGSGGLIWITFADSSTVEIPQSNPSQTAILSLAVSAQLANRQVQVRYPSGVCTGHHAEIVGLFLK
jgi:hypothetical protein